MTPIGTTRVGSLKPRALWCYRPALKPSGGGHGLRSWDSAPFHRLRLYVIPSVIAVQLSSCPDRPALLKPYSGRWQASDRPASASFHSSLRDPFTARPPANHAARRNPRLEICARCAACDAWAPPAAHADVTGRLHIAILLYIMQRGRANVERFDDEKPRKRFVIMQPPP